MIIRSPHTPLRAGTSFSLSVGFSCVANGAKPLNWYNGEHAIRRQVNGGGSERRAKRHSRKDPLACNLSSRYFQTPGPLLVRASRPGKHCCRIHRGPLSFAPLWSGQASRQDPSRKRRLSISLSRVRPASSSALANKVLRDSRDAPALRIMVSLTLTALANFRDSTPVRETSASAG